MLLSGKIIEEQKNYYIVDTEAGIVQSTLKGALKKKKNRLYVGDQVTIEVFNKDPLEGIIRKLEKRKNVFPRPAIANIEQVVLVNTFKAPQLHLGFVDRFLFTSEVFGFSTVLVFNKMDLLDGDERKLLEPLTVYYEKIGYKTLEISALSGDSIESFIDACQERVSILAGQSGTGKSTILAQVFPSRHFRTNELSKQINRGTHTTTNTTLLKLPESGYIADSPGVSYVDLPKVDEREVSRHFPEIYSCQSECRFHNCMHDNEPGCAVKLQVESGDIIQSRYDNYITICKSVKELRQNYRGNRRF